MGVQLTALIESNEISFEQLAGKRVAIDALNWIYQFLSIIRQQDGTPLKDSRGNVTSHLSGLFYRTLKLLEAHVRPIYVFDGEPPALKHATAEQRRDVRAEAMREWQEALARNDFEAARKYAQRSVTVTDAIIEDSKLLLEALGVPVVQAPSEGEALCSLMTRNGDAYATATQDYDALLFGCPRLVRNLSITGKRKRGTGIVDVKPELILLKETLERLGITQEQLIIAGILVGTDYNPGGVAGFGPKKALELVRDKKTLDGVLETVSWNFDVAAEDIYEFFTHPAAGDYRITFGEVNKQLLRKLLCNEHDFSEERIDSAIRKLGEEKEKGQKSLDRWL
ncbi:MAG: flap endonuclease-1 [Candidatus Aenigmarchaeota archaeon]|nr:flap endonuclease-1 [Candidatus Aenigmarchaeota archaeon]